ncbi:elongator complex protein 5 [Pectinophora gossypiella]|uniref:Elongator complex protein 5 n=1 Tax=Pectinophora gossypiella TaxID=13191 RepID=A0A1E1WLB9_PECGO|nr:elongator complex protein 5 [Pectinophora gossypiella]
MTLFKLRTAPLLLIEDDGNKNILPLLLDLVQQEKTSLNLFCYEQPASNWRNILKEKQNIIYYKEYDPDLYDKYTSGKCSVIVDSVNQMAICLSWSKCLENIKRFLSNQNVAQIILVLHKDCLPHYSKLRIHLNHIASAIISYDKTDPCKVNIQLKKSGKVVKSEEILTLDNRTGVLKTVPIVKAEKKEEEPEKPLPGNLTTFKIEVDQTDKLEKYKLKLPYMSKINEGESKVYYEPDAVDDWDEEDPDEDLDI